MKRHTRYQGLILKDHQVLLIQTTLLGTGFSFWLLPGGGLEPGETPEECVIREIKEETGLDVAVEKLLFEGPAPPADDYREWKTYLCHPIKGTAAPGQEPETLFAAITAVPWVDLRYPGSWGDEICLDGYTHPRLNHLRELLGYNI